MNHYDQDDGYNHLFFSNNNNTSDFIFRMDSNFDSIHEIENFFQDNHLFNQNSFHIFENKISDILSTKDIKNFIIEQKKIFTNKTCETCDTEKYFQVFSEEKKNLDDSLEIKLISSTSLSSSSKSGSESEFISKKSESSQDKNFKLIVGNQYFSRKYFPDCIKKKIKINHIEYIKFFFKDYILPKNPFKHSSNITIKINKKFYNMTIYEIFKDNPSVLKINDFNQIKFKDKHELLNMKLSDFLNLYYYDENCIFHEDQKFKIENTQGEYYYKLYCYHDKNFIDYFINENPNKERKDLGQKKPRKQLFDFE